MSCRVHGALVLIFAAALAGCGGPPIDDTTIVTIDNRAISISEFRLYLRANLLDLEQPDDPSARGSMSPGETDSTDDEVVQEDGAEIRSRLLDSFVDERLLLAEAERRGIDVTELEVAAYLAPSLEDTDAPPILPESRRAAARNRLKVDRLRELLVRELPPPDAAQIAAYVELHRERLIPKPRFVIRPLLFESLEVAERVHREIRRRRLSFDEAVVQHAPSNVRVASVQVAPEALPEEVRTQLDGQRVGSTSPPFDMHGQVYLFRLEDRVTVDPAVAESTAVALAREELERRRGQAAIERFVADLRSRSRVRVLHPALPFPYHPPAAPGSGSSRDPGPPSSD